MPRFKAGYALAVVCAFLRAAPARAQQFGQWSWNATVGAGQRVYQNLIDDASVTSYTETNFGLSLGVNGFIVHPAIARFTLGVDGLLSRYTKTTYDRSTRLGFRGDIAVLPSGSYPLRLFAARQLYDFTSPDRAVPFTLLGTPNASTTFGGRLQSRGGILSGTTLGFERTTLEFQDPASNDQVDEHEFVDWSRAGRALQHHFLIERRFRRYGTVAFDTEDLRATLEEHGTPFRSLEWRWDLSATALRRNLTFEGATSAYDSLTVRNGLYRPLRTNDRISFTYDAGFSRGSGTSTLQSHDLLLRYTWRPAGGWDVSPFVDYGVQKSEEASVSAPSAGLGLGWHGFAGALEAALSASASVGVFHLTTAERSSSDSFTGFSAGASLGHGNVGTLREDLEVSWSRNRLRRAGELIADLPEGGASLAGTGTEDAARARLTFRRNWSSLRVVTYGEWSRLESTPIETLEHFSVETLTGTLETGVSWLNVLGNVGKTDVHGPTDQEVRYLAVTGSLRPWRYLSVNASYRSDTRRLVSAPSLDGTRAEAGLDFNLGQFVLSGRGFRSTERQIGGPKRTNRGLLWSLSRRFGGWLPFVSAPIRRGVVR